MRGGDWQVVMRPWHGVGVGRAQLTRTRRIRHLIHAPFSRTSAVCSGRCRCLFLLLLLEDPLLDEVSELRRLASWGKDGGEGGYDEGGEEADEDGLEEREE